MTKPLKSAMNFVSNVAEDIGDFFSAPFEKAQVDASIPAGAGNKNPIEVFSAPAPMQLSLPGKTPIPGSKPSSRTRQASFLSGITGGAAGLGLGGLGSSLLGGLGRKGGGKSLFGE